MHLEDGIGLWSELLSVTTSENRPALFLDRDGVIVEDVHFLRRRQDVRLYPSVAEAISEVNRAGLPVVVVTNQSGIARGYLSWKEFAEVQDEMISLLRAMGARLDAVFACAYHGSGRPPYGIDDHEWRKPRAGMLYRAHEMLSIDLARSIIVGDRVSDIEAGWRAGLSGGTLVMTRHSQDRIDVLRERVAKWQRENFATNITEHPADAIRLALQKMLQPEARNS